MQKIIVSILVISACAGKAVAASVFYATVGGGWEIPSRNSNSAQNSGYVIYGPTAAPSGESIFVLPNVNWQNNYKNGFNLNAALGCHILSWVPKTPNIYVGDVRHSNRDTRNLVSVGFEYIV